jgi:hypothetical protein
MPTDPYAILRALVRAESLRNAPKTPPDSRQGPSKPAPERQTRPQDDERG